MLTLFVRTIIAYIVVSSALRLMGKRQIGELQPSEFVIAMLMSELATIPVGETSVPMINGIIPILILLCFEVIISFITLKSCKIRKLLTGRPSVIIYDGIINQKEMERLRFNIDDLVKEIRINGMFSIEDVRYAVMETNGKLSVFPKTSERGVTVSDLGLAPSDPSIPFVIISGGKLNRDNLPMVGKNEEWVNKELNKRKIKSIKEVLYMTCNAEGIVVVIKKQVVKK